MPPFGTGGEFTGGGGSGSGGGGGGAVAFTVVEPSGDTTGAEDTGTINALIDSQSAAAIDGAPSQGIQLTGGVFYTKLVLNPFTTFKGAGYGQTFLTAPATSTVPVIGSPASDTWLGGVSLSDFTIQGNWINGAQTKGLDFNSTSNTVVGPGIDHDPNPVIRNIGVSGTYDTGISLRATSGQLQAMMHDFFVFYCAVHAGHGVYIGGPDNIIGRGQIGGSGLNVETGDYSTNPSASGLYLDGLQEAWGQYHDIKSWYSAQCNFSLVSIHAATKLNSCRSEDCGGPSNPGSASQQGAGLYITGSVGTPSSSVSVTDFQSEGDQVCFFIDDYVSGCELEGYVGATDLSQYYAFLVVNGTNSQVKNNSAKVHVDPGITASVGPFANFGTDTSTPLGNIYQVCVAGDSPNLPGLGKATLVSGTVTITDPSITADSWIRISRLSPIGTVLGQLCVAPGAGSFVITAKSATSTVVSTDDSIVLWEILSY